MALEPVIAYGLRVYKNGSRLLMHLDKVEDHVVSAVVHVGHDEASPPWPLVIEGADPLALKMHLAQRIPRVPSACRGCRHTRPSLDAHTLTACTGFDGATAEVALAGGQMVPCVRAHSASDGDRARSRTPSHLRRRPFSPQVFYESAKCLHGRPAPFRGEWYASVLAANEITRDRTRLFIAFDPTPTIPPPRSSSTTSPLAGG